MSTHPEGSEDAVMVLGVLPHPRVTIIDVCLYNILVYHFGHDHKPLGEEVCAETIVGAGVSEIDDQLEGFVIERFECEQYVVD